ncbi:MAG: ATP-binding protein [Myxococcota bacterium]
MSNDTFSPKDFGASFKGFLDQMAAQAPAQESFFPRRLREHFGAEPSALAIVSEKLSDTEHPNLHLALESFVAKPGRSHELLGITSDHAAYAGIGLAQLAATGGGGFMGGTPPAPGPVSFRTVHLDGDEVLACTQLGLYLVSEGEERLAILVEGAREMFGTTLRVEVLARTRAAADACLAELRTAMRKRNVYRGHVVSLSVNDRRELTVDFHRLPDVAREHIILPSGVLDRIERQSIGFAKHAEALKGAGRHLKRGMLLHGPPGTGKTYTAMYLAGRMPDRTVLLITGRGTGLLEQACSMARLLQPATVILEDVDLVAEERTRRDPGCQPLLFELLNQMDGLADDADVLFVLTTNRPDILEPALAARPGRVDLAVEVPLPDAECRRRLFELYARGLGVAVDFAPYVERTRGVSAAFIRELLRRAALYAADEGGGLEIHSRHLDGALHEMVVEGGSLTRSLLGASDEAGANRAG